MVHLIYSKQIIFQHFLHRFLYSTGEHVCVNLSKNIQLCLNFYGVAMEFIFKLRYFWVAQLFLSPFPGFSLFFFLRNGLNQYNPLYFTYWQNIFLRKLHLERTDNLQTKTIYILLSEGWFYYTELLWKPNWNLTVALKLLPNSNDIMLS